MSEKFLVGWQCPKCGYSMSGWLSTGEPTARECPSSYARGKKHYPLRVKKDGVIVPYVCLGTMMVVHDERPPKLNVIVMERDPPLTEKERTELEGGMRGAYAHRKASQ